MENNEAKLTKKDKNGVTGFLVFIIVVLLLIISVGIGWYFGKNGNLFEKNKEQNTNTASNVENVDDKAKGEKIEPAKVMTADEKYAVYSKNMQNNIKSLGKDLPKELEGDCWTNIKHFYSTEEFPINGAYVNEKLEAIVTIKETGDQVKILDNAINCGVCSSGNGGTLYVIWAVDVNGDLYTKTYDTMDEANKMKFDLNKEQGLKNIMNVIQCSGPSAQYPVVVDIEGNIYNL